MQLYNKIMSYFWLAAGCILLVVISYLSMTQGIKKWGFYYFFVVSAFGMFFFKRWMMKRMEKHLAYLQEQQTKQQGK
jgi:hypothetical protein